MVIDWFVKNWVEVAAAVGLGGGSGIAAKKITDRKQDKQITALESSVNLINLDIIQLKNDIDKNTEFDKQFRLQMERERVEIKSNIQEVKNGLDTILKHLLSVNK